MSRTRNSALNLFSSMSTSVITLFISFITRTFFIHYLGSNYLGINSIFSNIMNLMSLMELGFGSAIVYSLYKPISQNDNEKIKSIAYFYRKTYQIIGWFILGFSLAIMLILPIIIKDFDTFERMKLNPYLVYTLFILSNVSNYWFFSYKISVFKAFQKSYLINFKSIFFSILAATVQIISLLFFKNYVIYIFLDFLFIILERLYFVFVINKYYPFLNEKNIQPLSIFEKDGIYKNVQAVFLNKLNNVIISISDNLVLAYFFNLELVGLYSNYLIPFSMFMTISTNIFSSISASIGNVDSQQDKKLAFRVFTNINFITFWVYSISAIFYMTLMNIFIKLWIGVEYIIEPYIFMGVKIEVSYLMGLVIFLNGFKNFYSTFRYSSGLIKDMRYVPVFGSIVNIVMSILLAPNYGIYGVISGTIFSSILTFMIVDPIIIYRKYFGKRIAEYWWKEMLPKLIQIPLYIVISYNFLRIIEIDNFLTFISFTFFLFISLISLLILINYRSKDLKFLFRLIKQLIGEFLSKFSKYFNL